MPSRIQRRRTKGWRMPPGAVYVGRPTRWGNPYPVGSSSPALARVLDARVSVALFRWFVRYAGEDFIRPLRGHDLACWCPLDQPCHADVLIELANGGTTNADPI